MSADSEAEARRNLIVADIVARTGIDTAMIERLVRSFYGRARGDPLISPIFERNVSHWDAHIARMCDFWSSVALMSGCYHGQPMIAHLPLPIDTPHFDRWLELFAESAHEVCPVPAAAHFIDRAHRIADSLELGIAAQKGEIRPRRMRPASSAPPNPEKRGVSEETQNLPGDVRPYKKTAVFDDTTMPASLRRRHCTKPGVWGLIRVIDGRLRYRVLDTGAESILDREHSGVAQPTQMHEVEPFGPVRFFIEFYSAAGPTPEDGEDTLESDISHE